MSRKSKSAEVPVVMPSGGIEIRENIEIVELSLLKPYSKNPRVHTQKHLKQIWASMCEFGWTQPVMIDEENLILAGHGRYGAAKMGGLEFVPCLRLSGLTPSQKQAVIISDNKLTENSEWNQELLISEVMELQNQEFDLSVLGFSEKEIEDLIGGGDASEDQSGDMAEPTFEILIQCENEADQVQMLEELAERGIKCRALI